MGERCTVEGTVQHVIFQNEENGYTVLGLLDGGGRAGDSGGMYPCVAPGEKLTADGLWVSHPSYGQQFAAETVERLMPETEEELISYLSSGIIKGVGPATAERLVERFGGETLAGYRGGAGAAEHRQGHHLQAGHGDLRRLPGADGTASGHGVSGPVRAAGGAGHAAVPHLRSRCAAPSPGGPLSAGGGALRRSLCRCGRDRSEYGLAATAPAARRRRCCTSWSTIWETAMCSCPGPSCWRPRNSSSAPRRSWWSRRWTH